MTVFPMAVEALATREREQGRVESNLVQLPLELLFGIIEFLDTEDRLCLSLCSRALYDSLDTAPFRALRQKTHVHQRMDVLQRLARDHPAWDFCRDCGTLHVPRSLGPLAQWLHKPFPCEVMFPKKVDIGDLHDTSFYTLKPRHVRYALERHHYGPGYGIPLDMLSGSEVDDNYQGITRMLDVEAGILADTLHLRTQFLLIADQRTMWDITRDTLGQICPHIHPSETTQIVNCKQLDSDSRRGCPSCFPYLWCKFCAVEFQVSFRTSGDGRQVLIITKLFRLGELKDWEDTDRPGALPGRRGVDPDVPPTSGVSEASSTWRAFDKQSSRCLSGLTRNNITTLCTRSYKVTFKRFAWGGRSGDAWFRGFGEAPPRISPRKVRSARPRRMTLGVNRYPCASSGKCIRRCT